MNTFRTIAASTTLGLGSILVASTALAQSPATTPPPSAPTAIPAGSPQLAPGQASGPPPNYSNPEPVETSADDDGKRISAAALVGFGTSSLGFGFGVRGGYTLPMRLYIGGTFVYHLGSYDDVLGVSVGSSLLYVGPEVGFELKAGPVMIRPYGGLSLAVVSTSTRPVSVGGVTYGGDASASQIAFNAGGTVLYPIGSAFVGGDARLLFTSGYGSLGIFATGGMRF